MSANSASLGLLKNILSRFETVLRLNNVVTTCGNGLLFFFKQVLSSWSLDIEAKRVVARKHFVQHCTQADNFGAKLPKNDLLNK